MKNNIIHKYNNDKLVKEIIEKIVPVIDKNTDTKVDTKESIERSLDFLSQILSLISVNVTAHIIDGCRIEGKIPTKEHLVELSGEVVPSMMHEFINKNLNIEILSMDDLPPDLMEKMRDVFVNHMNENKEKTVDKVKEKFVNNHIDNWE